MSGTSNEQIRKSYEEYLVQTYNVTLANDAADSLAHPDAITIAATLTFAIGLIQVALLRLLSIL